MMRHFSAFCLRILDFFFYIEGVILYEVFRRYNRMFWNPVEGCVRTEWMHQSQMRNAGGKMYQP